MNIRDTIEGKPHVKIEHRTAVGERNRIMADDVPDSPARLWTTNDSVMSIEWRLGAVWSEVEVGKWMSVG